MQLPGSSRADGLLLTARSRHSTLRKDMGIFTMKKLVILALSLIAAAVALSSAATAATTLPPPSGDIVSNGKPFNCTGPVNLNSVTVTIGASDPSNDGVYLRSGCTGYIGSITVDQWRGDGIKIGAGSHDLVIGKINVHCYAHDDGKHQDGVQVMGGKNIKVKSGYVGCYSANDSQLMMHIGAAGQELPTKVIFNKITADPAGVRDPTGQLPYTYGAGGAYGVSNGESQNSGYTNLTLLSQSNLHDIYQGVDAVNPVWSFTSLPTGVRSNVA
jgi:hypothetical protein